MKKMSPEKITCADCGVEMNHHANKLDYGDEPVANDSTFGGTLKEVHACPECGLTASRNT